MSETVIVMHIIKGYMHINNFLTEPGSHTLRLLFLIPYVQSKITTSEILHAISQHSTQEYYCNKDITETLFPTGQKELDEILWTVTWLWEERIFFFFNDKMFL